MTNGHKLRGDSELLEQYGGRKLFQSAMAESDKRGGKKAVFLKKIAASAESAQSGGITAKEEQRRENWGKSRTEGEEERER